MESRQELADAAVLWVLDGEYQRVVDAAVACITDGVESDELYLLAGSSPSDNYSERLAMVSATLDDLGLPQVPEHPDQVAQAAALITARKLAAGRTTHAEVDSWVTGNLTCDTRALMETALGGDPTADR